MSEAASLARARAAAAAAEAKAAEQIVVLDLREQTLVTDFFVICTATSRVHIRAIREGIAEEMDRAKHRLFGREGNEQSQWVLLDYGDVIVHLLTDEMRAFYKLERMWANAPRVEVLGGAAG
jgi:ribosome-associated protein